MKNYFNPVKVVSALVSWTKSRVILWAFSDNIESFIVRDGNEEIEIRLKNGDVLVTHLDKTRTDIENLIARNKLSD